MLNTGDLRGVKLRGRFGGRVSARAAGGLARACTESGARAVQRRRRAFERAGWRARARSAAHGRGALGVGAFRGCVLNTGEEGGLARTAGGLARARAERDTGGVQRGRRACERAGWRARARGTCGWAAHA